MFGVHEDRLGVVITPAFLRLSQEARPATSRQEHVGGHAKVPRQGPHMIERELAFAAQNHYPQVAAAAQKSREIRRHKTLFAEQVLRK